ncbi:hypothetical protein F2Q70_00044884 [Brassica cretica]|uniref:Uncharacterized protein n=1 Tax=Brassica cretica TaxID=69181 RepID=A0A8S9KJI1_BRACR|nr:hypothetical protein F2Q70_00044884 [Brassica cretica]KAF3520048.1 hypothetical protein DY000_02062990 [Brassica cretica]
MEFDHQTNISIPSKRAKNMIQYSTSSKDMVSPPLIKINRVVVNSGHQILIRKEPDKTILAKPERIKFTTSCPVLLACNFCECATLMQSLDVTLKALIPMKGSTIDVSFNRDG